MNDDEGVNVSLGKIVKKYEQYSVALIKSRSETSRYLVRIFWGERNA